MNLPVRFSVLRLAPILAAMALTAAPIVHAQGADATPRPVADFFKSPLMSAPKLSPDGTRIAMLVPGPGGRMMLAVADVTTPTRRVGVAKFDDADIYRFSWVNDKRLVFDVIDSQAPLGDQFGHGLYAVDRDAANNVFLVGRGRGFEIQGHVAIRPLRWNHRLFGTLRDGTNDVIVERVNFDETKELGSISLLRLNTETKATQELVTDEPAAAARWLLDRRGEPRAVLTVERKGKATLLLRAAAREKWQPLASYDIFDPDRRGIEPVAFDKDGALLVRALRDDPARTAALFRFDLAAKRPEAQPMLAIQGFDWDGSLVFDRGSGDLLGAHFDSDAEGVHWFEPRMKALQERVDALLPGTVNRLVCESCLSQPRAVVVAHSDRQPEVYFLFDRDKPGKDALSLIGASRPWIDAARMAEQDFVRVQTRDGQSMPVQLTRPQGKGPWPAVVLVHGGPWVRGSHWGWRADSQFLASRGWLVIEPEFRGSTGFGDQWFRAGLRQWGLAIQDDITDATRWAVGNGLADPRRLVIAGASFGGYAAMMGLVKDPDLYRAGINWVGVTDIDLMYSIDWSDAGDLWRQFGMPRLVGDRTKDKTQLERTSPLRRAAEITKPVLMAYGSEDHRVPLPHGTLLRDALRAQGKVEVEWVEYEGEGHGFLLERNRVDFWTRVERFLARHAK